MTASSVKCNVLVILLIGIVTGNALEQEGTSSTEIQTDTAGSSVPEQNELPGNRVLPVDAEHKSKITFPQQSLDPICVQTLRENLGKFLKRVKTRQARQDDGDDGDDGDEGGGLSGLLAGLGGGGEGGALGTLGQGFAVFPQFVQALTQISGAVNQGLNGTDTPNLPSFLVKQGTQIIQALTSSNQNRQPQQPIVHNIPGAAPPRKPRPQAGPPQQSQQSQPVYANSNLNTNQAVQSQPQGPVQDVYDYIDENVRQPLQPTVQPLRPNNVQSYPQPEYEPYPGGDPYLESSNNRRPATPTGVETINGLPPKTSLWQIYKSFRTRAAGNGTLTDFQLAHPAAFSNELLQSISNSISNVRGVSQNTVATEKPSSEILKEFYRPPPPTPPPPPPRPAIFNNPARPALSVYKPANVITGGGGVNNLISNNHLLSQQQSQASNEHYPEDRVPPSHQQEPELDTPGAIRVPNRKPGGSVTSLGANGRPTYNIHNNLATTGSLAQLQAQQNQGIYQQNQGSYQQNQVNHQQNQGSYQQNQINHQQNQASYQQNQVNQQIQENYQQNQEIYQPNQGNYQQNQGAYQQNEGIFVQNQISHQLIKPRPPSSSHLTNTNSQYVPSVSSLDQDEDEKKVGPQSSSTDIFNGIENKMPYKPSSNGILIQAPRLTPPPLLVAKPPLNIYVRPKPTQFPQFQGNARPGQSSLYPANGVNRPAHPNPPRPPAVFSTISSQLPAQKPLDTNALPASLIPQTNNKYPESEAPEVELEAPAQPEAPKPEGEEGEPENELAKPDEDISPGNLFISSLVSSHGIGQSNLAPVQNSNSASVQSSNVAPDQTQGGSIAITQAPPVNANANANENALLVNYLLFNFPELLAQSGNYQTSTISGFDVEGTTEIQEERTTPAPPAPPALDIHEFAPESSPQPVPELPPPRSPPVKKPINKQPTPVFSNNRVVYGVSPTNPNPAKAPSTNQFSQTADIPFAGAVSPAEGPQNLDVPIHSATPKATTPKQEQNEIANANFASNVQFPSAGQSKPEVVNNNALITDDTSVVDNAAPPFSNVYGTAPPPSEPQPNQENPTTPASIKPLPSTNGPPLGSQHLVGIPDSIAALLSNIKNPSALPPPIQSRPVVAGGGGFQGQSGSPFGPAIHPPSTGSASSVPADFGQKLQSLGPSAILEMSKLPWNHHDSFLPSALPQYIIAGTTEDYSLEQEVEPKPSSEKPISSASNPPGSEVSQTTQKTDSAIPEENSVEQSHPNFPPGKPIYWMNMYYPNGIPVLTRVRSTTISPPQRPRRRHKRPSSQATILTSEAEPENDDSEKPADKVEVDVEA